MQLIKHSNPKYGFFACFRRGNPVWQPDVIKARWTFKIYLGAHPSLTVKKILNLLNKEDRYKDKLKIINMW